MGNSCNLKRIRSRKNWCFRFSWKLWNFGVPSAPVYGHWRALWNAWKFFEDFLEAFPPDGAKCFYRGLFKGSLRRHLRRLVEARWPHSHITFKKSLLILDTIPDRHCLLRCFIGRLMWLHVAVSGLLRRQHWSCHWHFDPPSVTVRFQWLRLARGILCRHPTGISSRFLHSARNWSWPCSVTLLPAESSIWWTVSHV